MTRGKLGLLVLVGYLVYLDRKRRTVDAFIAPAKALVDVVRPAEKAR